MIKKKKPEMESHVVKNEDLGNGDHFLSLLKEETGRIVALVKAAEHELETEESASEEARGRLRVAVGKANMLLRKKFVQFEDLCKNNLGDQSKLRYSVTCEDLAGYWDTIVLQLFHVYKLFDEVEVLRKNNWKEPEAPPNMKNCEKKIASKLTGETILSESAIQTEKNTQVT